MLEPDTLAEGDCAAILAAAPEYSVDLVYLDPPFNSGRGYGYLNSRSDNAIKPGKPVTETAFDDVFDSMAAYLDFMRPPLAGIKRVLKPGGSVYLHCDSTAVHYLKVLMDEVFGLGKFRADIVWKRSYSHNNSRSWGRITDNILHYGAQVVDPDAVRVTGDNVRQGKYVFTEEGTGRRYTRSPLTMESRGGGHRYEFRGHLRDWRFPEARLRELEAEGRIHHKQPDKLPMRKIYVDENKGKIPGNLWTDIEPLSSTAKERVDYPTQKPLALLERIVKASSRPGEIVLDPFCGSGTALVAAKQLGRRYVGIDRNPEALRIAEARLAAVDEAADAEPAAHPLFAPKQP